MLVVSSVELEQLEFSNRSKFILETRRLLREKAPAYLAGLDDEEAVSLIDAGIGRAGRYGLNTERSVRSFIALQSAAGETFDVDPAFTAARDALTHPGLDQDAKIRRATAMVRLVLEAPV